MAIPTLVELAESGAHFGHHRSLTYPKAKSFIYAVRSDVALINLEQTQNAIAQAQQTIYDYKNAGKAILFVGTKRSVRNVVREVAQAIEASYITERWFGGMLTNFSTMSENIKKMNELEKSLSDETTSKLTKKERLALESKLARYHRFLGGLSHLSTMPDLLILAGASEDKIAIAEAAQLRIPVIAITDTDVNPTAVTYPIPANDDAPKAVELILRAIIQEPVAEKPAKKTPVKAAAEAKPVKKTKSPAAKATKASPTKSKPKAKKEA